MADKAPADEVIVFDDDPKSPASSSSEGSRKSVTECSKPAKDFYERFYEKRHSEKSVKNNRSGQTHYGTCKLCPESKRKETSNSESYSSFKTHVTSVHSTVTVSPFYH